MRRNLCMVLLAFLSVSLSLAQMVQQPDLPFNVSDARLDTNVVTNGVTFHLTLSNPTSSPLREIRLAVLARDVEDNPRAFQFSPFQVNVPPGGEKKVTLAMSNLLRTQPGQPEKFTAAIAEALTEAEAWQALLTPEAFAAALRAADPVPVAPVPVSLLQGGDCEAGFCTECRFFSRCSCGQQVGCIKSYSCSRSTCTCAFECNTAGSGCSAPSNCP